MYDAKILNERFFSHSLNNPQDEH